MLSQLAYPPMISDRIMTEATATETVVFCF